MLMQPQDTNKPATRLTLRSQLPELTRVLPWLKEMTAPYSLSSKVQFSIELCLEEALSNVIRHGFNGEPGHTLTLDFAAEGPDQINFIVEDSAPPFDPIEAEAELKTPVPASLLEIQPGGNGMHLLRKFSDRLDYQRLVYGNRLTIGFSIEMLKRVS
jgi:anti-sigma regulatory factor (Ser/Thr protein kinase)